MLFKEDIAVSLGAMVEWRNVSDKPSVNGVVLEGNKTTKDLGIKGVVEATLVNLPEDYAPEGLRAAVNAINANLLDAFGYTPEDGFPDADERVPSATPNAITDLSSYGRLNLIVDTNAGMAASAARLAEETDDTLDLFPAWRLTRFMWPNGKPRDWAVRWAAAGNAVGWQGACREEMVARKDSPIWQSLGDGAGGFTDTLGNPYPPFAFNSGMGWEDVDRDEAEALGLSLDAPVRLAPPSLAVGEDEADRARERFGDVFTDAMREAIAAYNEARRCPSDGAFLPADGACRSPRHGGQGGVKRDGDAIDDFTRQQRKYEHERQLLDEFKASDDHPTCEEVFSHTVGEIRKDLQRGFTADFGGRHKIVFCLKNLDEKYGDSESGRFDLGRLRILRTALGIRQKFASMPHGHNQIAFVEQGKLHDGERRIVITTSAHRADGGGVDLVARNVMKCDDGYIRKNYGFNPC